MKDTIVEDKILTEYRAVAGTSTNPEWPSYRVANYLAEQGYNIIPVNPIVEEVVGRKSYPDLSSIPQEVEMVDILRRTEEVIPVVEEAILT